MGTNFSSEKFENFLKQFNICHAALSSYNHQSIGQVEACIKFVKRTKKKCYETKADVDTIMPHLTKHSHTPVKQAIKRHTSDLVDHP